MREEAGPGRSPLRPTASQPSRRMRSLTARHPRAPGTVTERWLQHTSPELPAHERHRRPARRKMPGRPAERTVIAALHHSDPVGWIVADRGDLLLSPGCSRNRRSHANMLAGSSPVYVEGAGEPRPATASPPLLDRPARSVARPTATSRTQPGRDPRSLGRSAEWRQDDSSAQAAAAAACRSCRPTGLGSAISGQRESELTRPSRARSSSTCMASRMAPSIRRSRSVDVIKPRSACSRKIAQMCWSSASTVSTVTTVPTSTPGIPPRMPGRGRGFGPHCTVGRPFYRMKNQLPHGLHPRRRQLATRGHKAGRYVTDGSRPIVGRRSFWA